MWGKGTWKLNSKLLENHENKIKIRDTIKHLKEEKYRMEPLEWWDYFKMKIKKLLITIGIENKRTQENNLAKILKELKDKEGDRNSRPEELLELKKKINNIHNEKLKACLLRAKIDELNYMDKPSLYFYDLEKIRGKSENIMELVNDKGEVVKKPQDIINVIEIFFFFFFSFFIVSHICNNHIHNSQCCTLYQTKLQFQTKREFKSNNRTNQHVIQKNKKNNLLHAT